MIARVLPKLEIPALAAVLAALAFGAVAQFDQTALLSLGVVVGALVVFFARFETSKPALRQIMPTVVLAALAAAGRILIAAQPDFNPHTPISNNAGDAFGSQPRF